MEPAFRAGATGRQTAWAALAWTAGWAAMLLLDGRLDLANLAMVLVLASAVATLWLPVALSAVSSACAILAFNWAFVPPRHAFSVDLQQHALLLATMLAVSWIIAGLVATLRRRAESARTMAAREARLREWGDTLREASDPAAHASALQSVLADAAGAPVCVRVLQQLEGAQGDDGALVVGTADANQRAGLDLCIREGRAMGPGTGRHDEQPDLYLPLRGRGVTLGAAVLADCRAGTDAGLGRHLQALCDQMGGALQRSLVDRQERRTREHAQLQDARSALLAAISHDYRTPLATILGAASSLHDQADRLDVAQRRRLAAGIVEEAGRLARLADNTLQLARLDGPAFELKRDWESAEEIVGALMRRVRRRPGHERVRARLEPELPLLWCDAMLVSQLLENLVDNALKYSPPEAPVEVLVRRIGGHAMLAVRDRGAGVAPAWREAIFEAFRRGEAAATSPAAAPSGAGVGLAVCQAIARAHGGELTVRPRGHGGAAFEFRLPLRSPPEPPPEPPQGSPPEEARG